MLAVLRKGQAMTLSTFMPGLRSGHWGLEVIGTWERDEI